MPKTDKTAKDSSEQPLLEHRVHLPLRYHGRPYMVGATIMLTAAEAADLGNKVQKPTPVPAEAAGDAAQS